MLNWRRAVATTENFHLQAVDHARQRNAGCPQKAAGFVASGRRLISIRQVEQATRVGRGSRHVPLVALCLGRPLEPAVAERLPTDPRTEASAARCSHPEIRARRGVGSICPCGLVERLPSGSGLSAVHHSRRPTGSRLTSLAKANSAPGNTHTAKPRSSEAANPLVPVPKSRVTSLSPTFAGRDRTLLRL